MEEHPFWEDGGLVCCEPDDRPFYNRANNLAKGPFFLNSFLQNQFRPQNSSDDLLSSLLSDSYSIVFNKVVDM